MTAFDIGRAIVKFSAVLALLVSFVLLITEAYLHYCHYLLPALCVVEKEHSYLWLGMSLLLMIYGGLILWRKGVSPALEAIEQLLPFLAAFIGSIRPGGRRASDPPDPLDPPGAEK